MNYLVLIGVALLVATYWEYTRGETDTIFVLEWWLWFEFSRQSHPLIYWAILTAQAVAGVVMIIRGLSG